MSRSLSSSFAAACLSTVVFTLGASPGHAASEPLKKVLILGDEQDTTPDGQMLEGGLTERLGRSGLFMVIDLPKLGAGPKDQQKLTALDDADAARRSGREQFDNLELDAALRDYTKAMGKLEKAVVGASTIAPLTDTLLMLAATHLLMGQEKKARGLIERALILDETLRPEDAVYNPQMMEVFDAVASEVLGRDGYEVHVESDAPGALLFLDGRFLGLSPVTTRNVRPGRHYVRASGRGRDTVGKVADIKEGGGVVSLNLPKIKKDARMAARVRAAVESIEEPRMSPAVSELAGSASADEVILVSRLEQEYLVVRYQMSGEERAERAFDGDLDTARHARSAANALLDWLPVLKHEPSEEEEPTPDGPVASVSASKKGEGTVRVGPKKTETIAAVDADHATRATKSADNDLLQSYLFSPYPAKEYVLYAAYGAAAALAITAGVMGGLALGAQSDYYLESSIGGAIDHAATTDQLEGAAIKEDGESKALLSDILWGSAGAVVVTAALLHLLWDPAPAERSVAPADWSGGSKDEPQGMDPQSRAPMQPPAPRLWVGLGSLRVTF